MLLNLGIGFWRWERESKYGYKSYVFILLTGWKAIIIYKVVPKRKRKKKKKKPDLSQNIPPSSSLPNPIIILDSPSIPSRIPCYPLPSSPSVSANKETHEFSYILQPNKPSTIPMSRPHTSFWVSKLSLYKKNLSFPTRAFQEKGTSEWN